MSKKNKFSISSSPKGEVRWGTIIDRSPSALRATSPTGAEKVYKFKGFTMAEVLIAIAIIGVIAALVLPVMMKNYNNRIFAAKARRAYTAIVDACSHGLSDDQVKYPGDIINSYCEYIPGKSCTTGENGSVILKDGTVITLSGWGNNPGGDLRVNIDTNNQKRPNSLALDRWETVLSKDCKIADNNSEGTISFLKSHDWRISEDQLTEEEKLALALAKRRDFSKWTAERVSPITNAHCEEIKNKYGIENCGYNPDYWAAAVEKCGGVQNLPSEDDLVALAKELYPTCNESENSATTSCSGGLDTSKLAEYPGLSGLGSSWSMLWSGSEYNVIASSYQIFTSSDSVSSHWNHRNTSNIRVVCLGDLK